MVKELTAPASMAPTALGSTGPRASRSRSSRWPSRGGGPRAAELAAATCPAASEVGGIQPRGGSRCSPLLAAAIAGSARTSVELVSQAASDSNNIYFFLGIVG